MESSLSSYSAVIQRGATVFVEALLQGGAPWGFTLKGGLEHGEALIISKVEEGGKAGQLEHPLLVGDEVVVINEVELSGFRQEAISLVKGSYKTLGLTVRRECCPGLCCGDPDTLPTLCPHSSVPPPPRDNRPCSGGVKLRIKNRQAEAASRPHSWHSTKLGEGKSEPGMMQVSQGTMGNSWHHNYQASASITDLSGYEATGYLRKSPDQYSSRGSMESLDPQPHHPAHQGHGHSPHPAYSSCHQLSSAKSSSSIDHLHSKRDSAYSSFSTSSSIPEYLAPAQAAFSQERSYSMETVPQRGGGGGGERGGGDREGMQQADIRYVHAVYDRQQGVSQEQELSSASATSLRNSESRGGTCHRGSSSGSSTGSGNPHRHSVGPIWGPSAGRSSHESLRGAPAPPARSDSYAAIKNHERPNSWSSLEHGRSLRSLHRGSLHHSSGSVAMAPGAKGSYGTEGQLHTVIEKSPESSPTTKPRQGGSNAGSYPPPSAPASQSGRLMLPMGVYAVPPPEPHYAQAPSSCSSPSSSGVYPALAKESRQQQQQHHGGLHGGRGGGGVYSLDGGKEIEGWTDGVTAALENGFQSSSPPLASISVYSSVLAPNTPREPLYSLPRPPSQPTDRAPEEGKVGCYRSHLQAGGEGEEERGGNQVVCAQRQHNHQGPQGPKGPQSLQQASQGYRPSSAQSIGQERRDPYTPVQPRGERDKYCQSPEHHMERVNHRTQSRGESYQQGQMLHMERQPILDGGGAAQGQVAQVAQVPRGGGLGHSYAAATQPLQQPQTPIVPRPTDNQRHHSDSTASHHQLREQREREREKEHPLTRLENALVEVQRCASPDGSTTTTTTPAGGTGGGQSSGGRSLSVLEKVSRFERREQGKTRSLSTSHASLGPCRSSQLHERTKGALSGPEDIRAILDRSSRTLTSRRGSHDQDHHRDPISALQRSRSTFHLGEGEEGESARDFPWREGLQELLGPIQDTSFNRTYRDSVKDAQSKVLRSTSFRRKDLSVSVVNQPPPVPAKHLSLERRGPKTSPKPQAPHQAPPPDVGPAPGTAASPHAPKERHVVNPDSRSYSPPELPAVPPVGPPARIGGRRRLTMEQKKRSYSEPESMHEVGVSDPETAAFFRHGGGGVKSQQFPESSVADRRRIFEQAAGRGGSGGGPPLPVTAAASRPDLRQIQQDALAEYVERKRGRRSEGGGAGGRPQRPQSAYLQPGTSTPTLSTSSNHDTRSLSSTSSLMSLQEPGLESMSPGGRLCSTLPPGSSLQSCPYPGRSPAPRLHAPNPYADPYPEAAASSHRNQERTQEGELYRQGQTASAPVSAQTSGFPQSLRPQRSLGFSQDRDAAFERAAPSRSSGKSASAEDLLERSEERRPVPQHTRSRSSPSVERLNQDVPRGDPRMVGILSTEPGLLNLSNNRSMVGAQKAERPASASLSQRYQLNPGLAQANTPVMRRERQRNVDRQRAQSASALAASVGLPCPLSPPGSAGASASLDWQASDRLSQANLDAVVFKSLLQSGGDGASSVVGSGRVGSDTTGLESQKRGALLSKTPSLENGCEVGGLHTVGRQSSSDWSTSQETLKDFPREGSFCPEASGAEVPKTHHIRPLSPPHREGMVSPPQTVNTAPSAPHRPPCSPSTSPSADGPQPLLSLRISESALRVSPPLGAALGQSLEDYDDVFLHEVGPPTSPPPIRETDLTEDFPPPPPFLAPLLPQSVPEEEEKEMEKEEEKRRRGSSEYLDPLVPENRASASRTSLASRPSLTPQPEPQSPVTTTTATSPSLAQDQAEESLGLECPLLPRRERSAGELKVEALARQLVSRDPSLTAIVDTWGGKSTIDLMEDIFPSGGASSRQHRGSSKMEEIHKQDGDCTSGEDQIQCAEKGLETDLDEEESDLNQRKMELLQTLTLSVAALREEREALGEGQKQHRALGTQIDLLVQEHCKPNEQDKYRVLIGDLEKIVNLLLSLSGRLARVDNALAALEREGEMENSTEERESLQQKRRQLCSQQEDAWELKENLDCRERVVMDILGSYLTAAQLRDYQHFVHTKPPLLIRQRHLDELIRQGEEQLSRLAESLPPEFQLASSPSPNQCGSIPVVASSCDLHVTRSTTVTSL